MNLTNSLPDMGQGAKALKVTFCFDHAQQARIKHVPNRFGNQHVFKASRANDENQLHSGRVVGE
jgi:hypothetical protein